MSLSGCPDTIGAGIVSGTFVDTAFTLPDYICPPATITGSGSGTIAWSDGSESDFVAPAFGNVNVTQGIIELEITSGRFVGATGSVEFSGVPDAGTNCIFVPVVHATLAGGPLTLTI